MATANHRIIVQSDWDYVLRQKGGKAWVAYREPGQKGTYGEVKSQGIDDNLQYGVVSTTEGFAVESDKQGRLSVSYQDGKNICRYSFQSPDNVYSKIHEPKKNVYCMDVTSGGLGVSSDMQGKLKVWATDNGEVRRDLVGHFGDVYACRFFPSGIVILTGGADTQIKIWSAETGQCAVTLTGHKAGVMDVAIVDKGRNVISVSRDGTAKLWDCGQTVCLATFDDVEGGPINACHIAPSYPRQNLGSLDAAPGEREVATEGKLLLLACESNSLKAFGLQSRKKAFEVSCSSPVNCCTNISEHLVVYGTEDSHINVIDLRNTSSFIVSFQEARSAILSFQPYKQGCYVTTGDGSCFLLNKDLRCALELTGSDCDPLYKVVADDRFVYTCCRDGMIRKYRLVSEN